MCIVASIVITIAGVGAATAVIVLVYELGHINGYMQARDKYRQ